MKTIILETNSKVNRETLMSLIKDFFNKKDIIISDVRVVELPDSILTRRGRPRKYKFREMEIGDKIILCNHYSKYEHQKFGNHPRNWAKKSPDCKHYRFKTYKTDDNKIATIRIA